MDVLRTALASAGLRRLLTASAATYVGVWAFTILFAIYAYDKGGAQAVGLAAVVRQLPTGLSAPSIALFADRYPRRTVLTVSGVAQALLIAATAGAIAAGLGYGAVLAIAAAATVAGAPFRPAQVALIPQLAQSPTQIAAANVAWGAVEYAGFLGGSLAAAVMVAPLGTKLALALCAAPFAFGTLVFLRLPRDERPQEVEAAAVSPGAELAAGIRTIWRHPEMRLLSGVYAADAVVQGTVDVLLVTCAIALLKTGDSGVGVLNTAWGVGGVAGGWLALVLLVRGRLASGIAWGCLLAGLPLVVVGVWADSRAAVVMLAVVGIGYALLEAALTTFVQRRASDDVLARVFGVHESLLVLGMAIGGVVAAALVSVFGIAAALVVVGSALPVVALALRGPLGRIESGLVVPERAFGLLRSLDLFAPLPLASVENLAVRSSRMELPERSAVIRQGDEGNSFYVIDDGSVDVLIDGRKVAERHAGDFFGEIALLRDVPRTATVQTTVPTRLIVLKRQEFLNAVGAHTRSTAAATRVVDERTLDPAPALLTHEPEVTPP